MTLSKNMKSLKGFSDHKNFMVNNHDKLLDIQFNAAYNKLSHILDDTREVNYRFTKVFLLANFSTPSLFLILLFLFMYVARPHSLHYITS